MDSLNTDDQLTIVNRAQEYRISKKLISKIPYFEKMLSHECLESKENKVELDFDKQTFEIILNWIRSNYSFILIEMDYVMDLYELADYFGLDWICKECIAYFKENFSMAHLPFVIPKATATSKCINSGALNAFICRYFLKIANTTFWSKYPVETIEYINICALDVMVYSEYQVFNAILQWAYFKARSHFKRLLKLVRWCHLNEQDLSKIKEDGSFKSSGFEPIFCAPQKVNCDCTFNRTKQNYLVMIEKLDDKDLLIKVFDNNFTQLLSHAIKQDYSISSNIFHDEHVSDILFESGTGPLRIDWKLNKYVWMSSHGSFIELLKRIYGNSEQGTHLNTYFGNTENMQDGFKLLEGAENFILIYLKEREMHYFSRPIYENYNMFSHLYQCKATTLNNKIYLLTNKRMLYEFEIGYRMLKQTWSQRLCEDWFVFDSTLLTSSLAGDKIMVIDTNTANYICFDINTKASSKGRMALLLFCVRITRLLPTFLPLNTIRTCLNSNRNSEN
ncbi:uncharacterized protein LOC107370826 [Tetranychus urticae]|uniref:BTB domain-containing protein n=1 Tax=Tetranychus urticae TaxID=32264 RepID=T1JXM4_TETUR|nr:uncharacterized protein LOC107370826 [Tetranychus urticae]